MQGTSNDTLRGLALMMSGRVKESVGVFDAVLASDPNAVEARFNRAVAMLKLGESEKAAADFTKIALDEHNALRAQAAYHAALAFDRLGRLSDAQTWVDRALALDNGFDAAMLLSGSISERRGDFESAARSDLAYLRLHPDSTAAMLRLGVCASRAGRPDVAVTYLRKVVAAAPDSPEATEARKFLVMWE